MIPTSPAHSVSWTAPASPAVVPVPAVVGVAPAAAAARDQQAGLEQRRGQPRPVQTRDAGGPGNATDGGVKAGEALADERSRAQRSEQQAQRAREQAQIQQEAMEHLRTALRKVWDASGAVVEQALARDAEAASQQAARARSVDAYGTSNAAGTPTNLSKRV
jgi:hypothetical protein